MSNGTQPTHHIISMKRGETSNSKSSMWRCQTLEGDRVNIFQHRDPQKDGSKLFADAGYLDDMLKLLVDEEQTWRLHPIAVSLGKSSDGKWWEVRAVLPRSAEARPDPVYVPDLEWYHDKARLEANLLMGTCLYFDTETTGLGPDAEIIALAAVSAGGDVAFSTLLKPQNMAAVLDTLAVHGLSLDRLEQAPTLPEVYEQLYELFTRRVWCAFNAKFDTAILERNCMMHQLDPVLPLGVHDAMELYSQYAGLWDKTYQRFKPVKLVDAAYSMGINPENAHDALADTLMTRQLVERIALGMPIAFAADAAF